MQRYDMEVVKTEELTHQLDALKEENLKKVRCSCHECTCAGCMQLRAVTSYVLLCRAAASISDMEDADQQRAAFHDAIRHAQVCMRPT